MTRERVINVMDINISNTLPFVLISGPCQIESVDHSIMIASIVSKICKSLGIRYIFKASFDKANRTSATGKRGVDLGTSIESFKAVKEEIGCPILTDIHKEEQCDTVGKYVDILQIPAFLCRQTDLLWAAAKTGKVINIKKGQFVSPDDMKHIVAKMDHFQNQNIMLTDRGTSFGYNTLISDMRGLKIMSSTGCPVIFDATHSVQQPSAQNGASGGQREFVDVLARAAIAACPIAGIFIEVHNDPDNAPSDGPCMLHLNNMEKLLIQLKKIDTITKEYQDISDH